MGAAERDAAPHDEVRRHNHIPHNLALDAGRDLNRVRRARAVVENLAPGLIDLDIANREIVRSRIARQLLRFYRGNQVEGLLPGQRAVGRRRSRRELLQNLWLPRLSEQRIQNRRARYQHAAVAPWADQSPLLNAGETEVGIVVETRTASNHCLLLLAQCLGET